MANEIADMEKAMVEKRKNGGMDWRDLPYNQKEVVEDIISYAESVKDEFDAFVVLGIGGSALGAHIAAGALAHAPVAVGDQISGDLLFDIHNHITDGEIADAILSRFPKTPAIIVKLFEMIS